MHRILWSVLLTCFLVGCSTSVGDYPTEQLLLPIEAFPSGWEYGSEPRPLGPHTIGIGDEEDDRERYYEKHLGDETYGATHRVFQFQRPDLARAWYDTDASGFGDFADGFFDDAIGENLPGTEQLTYRGQYADKYLIVCDTPQRKSQIPRCIFLALYDRFVVSFNSAIAEDVMLIDDFNDMIVAIDHIMAKNVGLSPP